MIKKESGDEEESGDEKNVTLHGADLGRMYLCSSEE